MISKRFLPYNEAVKFAQGLKLGGQNDWRKFCGSGLKPNNIPSTPNGTYKNIGWVNWMNWLGTNNHTGVNRKYKVNDNFFKTWTHDMAYILGFWWADGFIYKNRFYITQHKKDQYLLEIFLKKMESDNPIRTDKRCNCIFAEITSKSIVEDIKALGGTEKKSKTCIFPNVPEKFLSDFIRGHFDGDGCITHNFNQCRNKFYTSNIASGSMMFLEKLHSILKEKIPEIKGTIHTVNAKKGIAINGRKLKSNSTTHTLCLGVNDTKKLGHFIYRDNPNLKMERKYNKFIEAGEITIANKDRDFLSYEDAKKYVNKLNIKSHIEWLKYAKTERPKNIPSNPYDYYYHRGWESWGKWLKS